MSNTRVFPCLRKNRSISILPDVARKCTHSCGGEAKHKWHPYSGIHIAEIYIPHAFKEHVIYPILVDQLKSIGCEFFFASFS